MVGGVLEGVDPFGKTFVPSGLVLPSHDVVDRSWVPVPTIVDPPMNLVVLTPAGAGLVATPTPVGSDGNGGSHGRPDDDSDRLNVATRNGDHTRKPPLFDLVQHAWGRLYGAAGAGYPTPK